VTGSTGPGSSGREVLCGLALAERLRRRGAREPVLVTLAGPGRGRFQVSVGGGRRPEPSPPRPPLGAAVPRSRWAVVLGAPPPPPRRRGGLPAPGPGAEHWGVMDARRARVELRVGEGDTAVAMGSGDVPVLATPRLVALCEQAACAAVAGLLDPGATSVGTWIELEHLAPSPVGARVVAEAVLTGSEGRRLEFEVVATQGEVMVARGRHRRQVVNRGRFLGRLGGGGGEGC
jgi:fluoroacetyl-CoA thioesterase